MARNEEGRVKKALAACCRRFSFGFDSPNALVYDADMSNGRIAAASFPRASVASRVGAFFFFTSREGVAVSLLK